MTQYVIANNVNTQLAAALPSSGAGSTTVTLASSANLPTLTSGQIMPLTLNDAATGQSYEIVYVTAISGVSLTVTRAQEGTGALNWNVGDYSFCAPTAGTVALALGNPNNTFAVASATASQHAVNLGQFASTLAISGYQKLPSGLIIQWGNTSTNSSGIATVTLPIAFPHSLFMAQANYIASLNGVGPIATVSNNSTTSALQINCWITNTNAPGASAAIYWIAIGN